MRTTVAQIAREAGVSPATVDRVLNDREGVRPRTRDIVMQIATRLGYFGPAESDDMKKVRMDFVLPAGSNSFMQLMRRNLMEEAQSRGNVDLTLHQIEGFDPSGLSARLMALRGKTDAVGLVSLDHPEVREAVNALSRSGVKISTLLSDLPSVTKVGYVGVDNRAAGRLAGLLVGRFLPRDIRAHVAVFIGSQAYRGHEEREMGFRSILAEEYPDLTISGLTEVSDDRDRAYSETLRLLDSDRISAIYNVGSGNQGIARALRERRLERDVVFVGHDLTEATRMLLLDRTMDAVIDQNPRVQAREIVKLLVSAVKGSSEPDYPPRLQVVFRENIPSQ
ncbi:LacI family DNA-binding transcriptional regulator [Chachezhania antarctica]|uniref:LacI family DNA-binding transcriptional regulator n=1 Tax=Chachezhania antarctica TaxID=2340860 RepID=UPI000EACB46D|nr:LacI family DNA-binding transcriptional regulator [Chachezhania antarctica]|tara:strand:+ start:5716 stop:6723 length:1008 start_codon:yes stop_codon:yes gene_type:complete